MPALVTATRPLIAYGAPFFCRLPMSLGMIKAEMIGTANWAWSMYPGLSVGAMNTLILHGSEEQKQHYLTKLASGEWSGTMCLTEPHCGTDLAQVKTKAEPNDDGETSMCSCVDVSFHHGIGRHVQTERHQDLDQCWRARFDTEHCAYCAGASTGSPRGEPHGNGPLSKIVPVSHHGFARQ